jgi:ribulose-5-phosphate 4-epimerase/fuculose-1-phosphate aldolase
MRKSAAMQNFTSDDFSSYAPGERETRVDLAACYRLVDHFGMTDLVSNHISARVPQRHNEILINPFGMMYEEITASSLIKVDLAGNVLHNPHADYSVNLAGYMIHSAVHEARPDVGCVIHTHTVAGIAIASLECGLLPVSQSAMRFADVAYHDFEGVAFEPGEKERLGRDLGQCNVMILRNHGLLACGATIAEAFNNIYRLERACQIQAAAMACNSPIIQIPPDLVRKAGAQYGANPVSMGRKPSPLGVTEWPAMLRLLDRRDASYRT